MPKTSFINKKKIGYSIEIHWDFRQNKNTTTSFLYEISNVFFSRFRVELSEKEKQIYVSSFV